MSGEAVRKDLGKEAEMAAALTLPVTLEKYTGFDPASCPNGAVVGTDTANALTAVQLVLRHMLSEMLFQTFTGIKDTKAYKRADVNVCREKIRAIVPVWTVLHTELLRNAFCVGEFDEIMNLPEQMISGQVIASFACEISEVDPVQVLEYGFF